MSVPCTELFFGIFLREPMAVDRSPMTGGLSEGGLAVDGGQITALYLLLTFVDRRPKQRMTKYE